MKHQPPDAILHCCATCELGTRVNEARCIACAFDHARRRGSNWKAKGSVSYREHEPAKPQEVSAAEVEFMRADAMVRSTGTKADTGKPRMFTLLLSGVPHALREVVAVLEHGAEKYGDHNWRTVEDARARYLDAATRHLQAVGAGEHVDRESGRAHLAHAICSLLFVLEREKGVDRAGPPC